MKITYQTFSDKEEYQSLLIINAAEQWKETLYFSFYTPWGEEKEQLFSGRYMSDVHFKHKACECVRVFDFHNWDEATLNTAMEHELPPLAFDHDLREVLEQALENRDRSSESFSFSLRPVKVKK